MQYYLSGLGGGDMWERIGKRTVSTQMHVVDQYFFKTFHHDPVQLGCKCCDICRPNCVCAGFLSRGGRGGGHCPPPPLALFGPPLE